MQFDGSFMMASSRIKLLLLMGVRRLFSRGGNIFPGGRGKKILFA